MKKFRYKSLLFYIAVVIIFSLLIIWIINAGKSLEKSVDVPETIAIKSQWSLFLDSFSQSIGHPLAILLLQIIAIIIVARFFSWICLKINQPTVIGEIVAGIVLGPSLFGMYFPELSAALFPTHSLSNLQFLSQIGLILFMFVIGMELDLNALKNRAHEAVVVSHASIIIPFALGMGLAFFTYSAFAPEGVKFIAFSLFLGISMSITAFPVLARMVQERGIHKTPLGALVITCAAVDDITAWSALAAVIAIVKAGSLISSLPVVLMAVLYVIIMIKIIRPFLKRIGDLHASRENLSRPIVALFFLILLMSAYATEIIGIHALFGAFIAGTIIPDNQKFKQILIEKVEDIALVILLPLFFVYTGLRTQIGLLNEPDLWLICGLVILVAITGKFAGSAIAARFVGQSWKNSLTIGALMNTRGLVELVALNIGYELGVLTPEIFTMLVIMALVTTFMTAPALDIIGKYFAPPKTVVKDTGILDTFRILISFGKPEMGRILLRVAHGLTRRSDPPTAITAFHLSPGNLFNKYKIDEYEEESFAPIHKELRSIDTKIQTVFKVSEDIDNDIAEEANRGNYDLLLMGMGHSIYEGSALGNLLGYVMKVFNPERLFKKIQEKNSFDMKKLDDRTRKILTKVKPPVGVFLYNGLKNIKTIVMPVVSSGDVFLLEYARMFINNSEVQVTVWDAEDIIRNSPVLDESIQSIMKSAPDQICVTANIASFRNFDLMMVSSEGWKRQGLLHDPLSTLIMRN